MHPREFPELLDVEQRLLEVVARLNPADADRAPLEEAQRTAAQVLDEAVARSMAVLEATEQVIDRP